MVEETRVQSQVESLHTFLLNTQHLKLQIKAKWNNPGKGVVPSLTPWCINN